MKNLSTTIFCRALLAVSAVLLAYPPDALGACTPTPAGLVSWLRAENDAADAMGRNSGIIEGATFSSGVVGQAFRFSGTDSAVRAFGNPLDIFSGPGLTLEMWINPADVTQQRPLMEWNDGLFGVHFWIGVIPESGGAGTGCLFANFRSTDEQFHTISTGANVVDSNVWQHVAVTYNKSNGVAVVYLDGALVAQENIGPNLNLRTAGDLYLGFRPFDGGPVGYAGLMDEVSVYNRALSSQEIEGIFAAGSLGKCLPLTSDCVPIPGGLVSWWKGDDNFQDVSSANSGVPKNGVIFAAGKVGQSFSFNGTNQYVELSNNPSLNPTGSFSIEAWVYPNEDHGGKILGKWGDTGDYFNARSYHFALTVNSGLIFAISDLEHQWDPAFHYFSVTNVVPAKTWSHVAAVYDRGTGTRRIYVNGIRVAERTDPPITIFDGHANAAIGADLPSSSTIREPFNGLIDELGFYSRALTAPEIENLFQAGSGKCMGSGQMCATAEKDLVAWWRAEGEASDVCHQYDGILQNGVGFTTGKVGQAFSFDGINDSVAIPRFASASISNQLTVEFWFKADPSVPIGTSTQGLVTTDFFGFEIGDSWRGILLYISTDGGASYRSTADFSGGGAVVSSGQWHHLAGTYDGNRIQLYVDGVRWGNPTPVQGNISQMLQNSYLALGSSDGRKVCPSCIGNRYFKGQIDEVAAYARVLSAAEIYAIYLAGAQGKCSPCIPLPSGMISWWAAEGNFLDQTLANLGTPSSEVTFTTGVVEQGFCLDGTQVIELENSPSLNPAGSFSIEGWINPKDDNPAAILSKWGESGDYFNNRSYHFAVRPDWSLSFSIAGSESQGDQSFQSLIATNVLVPMVWNHVAAVYDQGTGTRRLYVNGQQVAQRTNAPVRIHPGLASVGIGGSFPSSGTVSELFNGCIDELAIYSKALATAEIQRIFESGGIGKCAMLAKPLFSMNPTSRTANPGETVILSTTAMGAPNITYQWIFNGMPIPGATNSTLIRTDVDSTVAGTYSVLASNVLGIAISSNAVLEVFSACASAPDGLVAWWRGEGNAQDAMELNHGTLFGGTTIGEGRVGAGFVFNGATDSVTAPDSQLWAFGTNDFSIEFWVRFESLQPNTSVDQPSVMFVASDEGPGFVPKWAFSLGGERLSFILANSQTARVLVQAPFSPYMREWYHLAVVRGGNTFTAYVNGAPIGQEIAAINIPDASALLTIGQGEGAFFLYGQMDEISVYQRALSGSELQRIVTAGSSGKCGPMIPPSIVAQPQPQVVWQGNNVQIGVTASGSMPLRYQWFFNGTNLPSVDSATLFITNVQPANAGDYFVIVSNGSGRSQSHPVELQVIPPAPCVAMSQPPLAWWRGDDAARDFTGSHDATFRGGTQVAPGPVGSAFSLNGVDAYLEVPDDEALSFGNSDFAIEFWVKFNSLKPNSTITHPAATFLGHDEGPNFRNKWIFSLGGGKLCFILASPPEDSHYLIQAPFSPAMRQWYHLALVRDGDIFTMYANGFAIGQEQKAIIVPNPAAPLTIGQAENDFFLDGLMDEIAIYGHALTASTIQKIFKAGGGGKCATPVAPVIRAHPQGMTGFVGGDATLTVTAQGTLPLNFQWYFQDELIPVGTNSTLHIPELELSDSGAYRVVVTNLGGSTTSSNAVLTVTYPPSTVRFHSRDAVAGRSVTVPIHLNANGNESAVGFSFNFDQSLLSLLDVKLGGAALAGSLLLNTNELSVGKMGVALSLPPGAMFPSGQQEVALVTFQVAVRTQPASTVLSFGDLPIKQQVGDSLGGTLLSSFENGTLTIAPSEFEADVSPRPSGDRELTVSDWVLVGRFATKLDSPQGSEFPRADCAPRATFGDGLVGIVDWVQAGRYAARLDSMAAAEGPGAPLPIPSAGGRLGNEPATRTLRVENSILFHDQTVVVPIYLESEGGENGLGFSVAFNPDVLTCREVKLGTNATGAALQVNVLEAHSGRIAAALALPAGTVLPAGTKEVARLSFLGVGAVSGEYPIMLTDVPVRREFSDANASPLEAAYVNGLVSVNPVPNLRAFRAGNSITVSWPLWATNYALQEASGPLSTEAQWSIVSATPTQSSKANILVLPIDEKISKFYRLLKR